MHTLEFLEKTFSKHAKEYEKERHETIEGYKKDYPGKPLPAALKEDFNIPSALLTICKELVSLKKQVSDMQLKAKTKNRE